MTLLTLAETAFLVSFWKPALLLPPFGAWAWLISTKLDKDARHFHLNHRLWNGIHLAAGGLALAAALLIPFFFISWPVAVILLAAPIVVYWQLRNKSVPEGARFTLSNLDMQGKMEARRQRKAVRAALITFSDPEGVDRKVPGKEDPLLSVHVMAEDVLGPAIAARATKVEIAVSANGTAVAQTVDGVRYKRQPVPAEAGAGLIDYLKNIAKLDLQDRRRRQAGRIYMRGPSGRVEVSLTTAGSSAGQMMTLEFDRERRQVKPFDGVGLLPSQLDALKAYEQQAERHGIILLSAPSGHGLTTTAYSFLSRHDAYTSNIKTLEREVTVRLDGVDQVTWDANNPNIDFATNLQSMLRRDPDIVLTGEITDSETAGVAVGPGMSGPLIYIPVKASSVSEAEAAWVRQVGDVKKATRALRAVVNQRLLRSLCPNCRQAYPPTADQLKKLGLAPGKVKQLFRSTGKVQVKNKIENCAVCGGTGYLGQTAAFEVFIVDDEARKMLAGNDLKGALAHARRNKMILLQEAALSKVLSGETTLEEVARILAARTTPSESGTQSAKPAA